MERTLQIEFRAQNEYIVIRILQVTQHFLADGKLIITLGFSRMCTYLYTIISNVVGGFYAYKSFDC